jgi:hypothetical protein
MEALEKMSPTCSLFYVVAIPLKFLIKLRKNSEMLFLLETENIVPADVRFIETNQMKMDESTHWRIKQCPKKIVTNFHGRVQP